MEIIKIKPSEGCWLFNGDVFSDEVTSLKSRASEWREVTNEYKLQWEIEHPVKEVDDSVIEE